MFIKQWTDEEWAVKLERIVYKWQLSVGRASLQASAFNAEYFLRGGIWDERERYIWTIKSIVEIAKWLLAQNDKDFFFQIDQKISGLCFNLAIRNFRTSSDFIVGFCTDSKKAYSMAQIRVTYTIVQKW